MADKLEELDRFHWHEAMDRAQMLHAVVQQHLLELPVIQSDMSLKSKVEHAVKLLWEVFQEAGAKD